jgi:hypothetical protein
MRVHLPLPAASQSVTVPANTLIFRKAGLRVAVVQNSRPQLVTVTIARDYGEKVEIISGLRPTDAVPTDECARDVQYRRRQRAHWGDASGLQTVKAREHMSASGYARVLFTCSELYPLIKTGGLADVCAALPRPLAREGVDVRRMLPAYPCALAAVEGPHEILRLTDGGRILRARVPDSRLLIYLFDQPDLFSRAGNPYQDEHGTGWPDNHRRFCGIL